MHCEQNFMQWGPMEKTSALLQIGEWRHGLCIIFGFDSSYQRNPEKCMNMKDL